MKHYLIDSENVGDFWIPLLTLPAKETELIVFYTKNSPHMSYDSLIKLKESDRTVTFIKCYEGTNALDFQLCSELGYRICNHEGDDFIIVTSDAGYDAAVKYWRHKGYSVKRIAGKDSRSAQSRKKGPVRVDVLAEVNAFNSAETDHESDLREEPAEMDVVTFADEEQVQEVTEKEVGELVDEVIAETVFEEDDEESFETVEEDIAATEESSVETDSVENEDSVATEEPVESEEPTAVEAEEPAESEEPSAEEAEEPAESEEPAAVETEKSAESEEPATVEAEEPAESEEPAAIEAEELAESEDPVSVELEEEKDFAPDHDEIVAIVNCVGLENLAELHNQLIQFYGEHGKDLYLSIKNGSMPIESLKWNKQEKFLYYSALIFRHCGEDLQDVNEDTVKEFADFLLSNEKKRQNLNALRYALIKRFGKDRGRKYYFMLKPYVKAMNQM